MTKDTRREKINENLKEFIKENQNYDQELYEIAYNKFELLMRKNRISKKEIIKYRRKNFLLNKITGPFYFLINQSQYFLEKMGIYQPDWKKIPSY